MSVTLRRKVESLLKRLGKLPNGLSSENEARLLELYQPEIVSLIGVIADREASAPDRNRVEWATSRLIELTTGWGESRVKQFVRDVDQIRQNKRRTVLATSLDCETARPQATDVWTEVEAKPARRRSDPVRVRNKKWNKEIQPGSVSAEDVAAAAATFDAEFDQIERIGRARAMLTAFQYDVLTLRLELSLKETAHGLSSTISKVRTAQAQVEAAFQKEGLSIRFKR